jgi:hypothetical protein
VAKDGIEPPDTRIFSSPVAGVMTDLQDADRLVVIDLEQCDIAGRSDRRDPLRERLRRR